MEERKVKAKVIPVITEVETSKLENWLQQIPEIQKQR